jgi:Tfp pilus assembly protein PilV
MDAQAGFALIEVLISAVILGLVVIATFTGFDVADHASADERARAQADVIAQQDEDRLRSLQIDQLSGLNETRLVEYNKTHYTVESTGEFITDATGETSCSSSTSASYVRTTSKVTWSGAGARDPVVETSLISPPAGGALIVKIINSRGEPVDGMPVVATGPSPSTATVSATTGIKGCVIFAGLAEGEYKATASETGWINSKSGGAEPLPAEQAVTVAPGTTDKKEFEFDRPGELVVSFAPSTVGEEAKGDTFVAQDTGIPSPGFRPFGTLSTYATTVTSGKTIFPFPDKYAVYAGTCEADEPTENLQSGNPGIEVKPNETAAVTVPLPAINIKVMSGTSASPGSAVTEFLGSFEDKGCGNQVHTFPYTTNAAGELHKGMPFGAFSLCVASKQKVGIPAEYRKLKGTAVENKSATGSALYTIYLGSSSAEHGGFAYTCP